LSKTSINQPGPTFPEPLYSLQAGRAFAAIAVLLLHADRIVGAPDFSGTYFAHFWFSGGGLGVEFFFALSGFIILHAHAHDIGRPGRLGRYFMRRAVRIYPIYWVILSLSIAGPLLLGQQFAFAELFHNYSLLDPHTRPRLVTVAWTLFHESLFYLAFAALILNRWLGAIVFTAWLLAIVWFQGRAGSPEVITSQVNLGFGAGMLACLCADRLPVRAFPWPLIAGMSGLAYIVWATNAAKLEYPPQDIFTAASCGLVVMGLAMADRAKAWVVPRSLVFLGAASYSIYLFQGAALSGAANSLLRLGGADLLPPAISVGILAAFGVAAGSATYWMIERPILRRARPEIRRAPAEPGIRLFQRISRGQSGIN
jgi:exopolysaccharide production protein ExoZ